MQLLPHKQEETSSETSIEGLPLHTVLEYSTGRLQVLQEL